MAKISKEEIRKRLQKQTQVQPVQAEKKEQTGKSAESSQLTTDLRSLGLTTGIVLTIFVTLVILKLKTDLLDQLAENLFQLLNFS